MEVQHHPEQLQGPGAAPSAVQQQQQVAGGPRKRAKTTELFRKLRTLHDAHRVDASRLETIQKLGAPVGACALFATKRK